MPLASRRYFLSLPTLAATLLHLWAVDEMAGVRISIVVESCMRSPQNNVVTVPVTQCSFCM